MTNVIRKLHRLNADSLTCLLLRKLNNSIDDRFIKYFLKLYQSHFKYQISCCRVFSSAEYCQHDPPRTTRFYIS